MNHLRACFFGSFFLLLDFWECLNLCQRVAIGSFLKNQSKWKVAGGKQVYRSSDGERLYQYDSLHCEVEVYNKRGKHLGALDSETGVFKKGPVKGRKIDVK